MPAGHPTMRRQACLHDASDLDGTVVCAWPASIELNRTGGGGRTRSVRDPIRLGGVRSHRSAAKSRADAAAEVDRRVGGPPGSARACRLADRAPAHARPSSAATAGHRGGKDTVSESHPCAGSTPETPYSTSHHSVRVPPSALDAHRISRLSIWFPHCMAPSGQKPNTMTTYQPDGRPGLRALNAIDAGLRGLTLRLASGRCRRTARLETVRAHDLGSLASKPSAPAASVGARWRPGPLRAPQPGAEPALSASARAGAARHGSTRCGWVPGPHGAPRPGWPD